MGVAIHMVYPLRATHRRWLWADIYFHLQMTPIEQRDDFWQLTQADRRREKEKRTGEGSKNRIQPMTEWNKETKKKTLN